MELLEVVVGDLGGGEELELGLELVDDELLVGDLVDELLGLLVAVDEGVRIEEALLQGLNYLYGGR